ncbi:MAG: DUF5615 family PIN-like protein [Bacteroidia bacterium]|nr:DUF5615 family PIN-like protein [Bacteroidia bacterium]
MRFLVDECTGPIVAEWLGSLCHDVFSVYDKAPGLDDENIITKANLENYILITNDKNFGELVFRMRKPHKGIILMRLKDEQPKNKIAVIEKLLKLYSDKLSNNFIVVTENTVRIAEKGIINQK